MKFAPAIVGLFSFLLIGAAQPRETQLEALKMQFPQHSAGAITDKTDPLIRDVYFKFKKQVDAITLENLPEAVGRLRKDLTTSLSYHGIDTPSTRYAREQNYHWLSSRMIPYVKRLEQFQRGR